MSAALTDTEKRTYRIGNAVIDASLPPAQWEFSLDDVWKVLEKLPRYLGGSSRTVAEHSLAVGDKAFGLADAAAEAEGYDRDVAAKIAGIALWRGYWHDASEAFTGDIPGPMKRHLNPRLRDFEDDIQEIVYRKAGVGTKEILESVGSAGLDIINRAVSQADADDYRGEQAAMSQPDEKLLGAVCVGDFQEGHSAEPPPPGAASSTPPPEPPAAPRPLWADLKFDKDRLLDHHEDMCGEAWRLMSRKNNDYAGAGGTSPFKNFLHAETLGLCTVEQGMVVRLSDKLQRLAHFVSGQEMQVKDEALQDTILDIINYAVLISAYTKAKKDGSL